MKNEIKTLTVIYDTHISSRETVYFRGAVIKSLGNDVDLLYHNHIGDTKFRFSYPLIQYKCLSGKAAITCVEEGTDIIGQFLSQTSEPLMIGKRSARLEVEKVIPEKTTIQITDAQQTYMLRQWLPLNSKNYEQYLKADSMVDKLQILENVLAGNIISFLKGVNINLEGHFDLHITDIINQRAITFKDIRLMSFDIQFKANISLPSYIGLGKNSSVGFGVLSKKD